MILRMNREGSTLVRNLRNSISDYKNAVYAAVREFERYSAPFKNRGKLYDPDSNSSIREKYRRADNIYAQFGSIYKEIDAARRNKSGGGARIEMDRDVTNIFMEIKSLLKKVNSSGHTITTSNLNETFHKINTCINKLKDANASSSRKNR